MIGFNALGRMGRLCNQMFQYAALRGLSSKSGAEICIPYYQDAVDDGIGNMLRTELFDSFNIKVNNPPTLTVHKYVFAMNTSWLPS